MSTGGAAGISTVAVIGAGAAGLVTAAELLAAGFHVTVLEQGSEIGGLWCYKAETEDDPLGLHPSNKIYSSLYDNLHTNLPRDLMAFWDYPFDSQGGGADNWSRYPHHTLVLQYLQNYCHDRALTKHIRFQTRVIQASQHDGRWTISCEGQAESLQVDALVVCNGHYSEPKIVRIPDMEHFRGEILHAHNYRRPAAFEGLDIAILGTSASGFDLALELSPLADRLHWLGHEQPEKALQLPGVICGAMPSRFTRDGLTLASGHTIELDAFIFATGYRYHLPFLSNLIPVQDNRVGPLYYDMIHPSLPTLGFVGLPYLVIPFPLFQIQARWLVNWFQTDHLRQSKEVLQGWINRDLDSKTDQPTRQHHRLGERQFGYMNQLLNDIGAEPLPGWFTALARASQEARLKDPVNFRQTELPALGPTKVSF